MSANESALSETCGRTLAADLPKSVQLAADVADLDEFLESVSVGFHWAMFESLEDGVYILDMDRRIRYWSTAAERITGYKAAEILSKSCADGLLRHVDAQGVCFCGDGCPMAAVVKDGAPRTVDVFLHHKDGHRIPVRVRGAPIRDWQGRIIGAFETFSDISEATAATDRIRALEAEAYLDPLTGIANRRFLERALRARVSELAREGLRFGVIMADVDHFKRFNDEYGHEIGDTALKTVAKTLEYCCRSYDLPGRWGGEEFVVLAGKGTPEGVQALADRVRALVAESTLNRAGQWLQVTVSLGATIARDDDDEASLVARADELMYQSKSAGRNRVTFGM